MRSALPLCSLALAFLWLPYAFAADAKTTVVLDGLDNPTAVALQPGGDLFVAESGAGRIVRLVDGKPVPAIVDFPLDIYGKGPKYNVGPLGLAFNGPKQLVVGDGGFVDGQEFIRVFDVPERGAEALHFDKVAAKVGPLGADGDIKAEGNLYGVAVTKAGIFATCNGDDTKGWIARATITGTKFGPLERFIATKEAVNVDAPVAITVDSKGQLVVGQMGEVNLPTPDSRLDFYNAANGKLLLDLETTLYDITGLAYSPKTGLLYATDFAWAKPEEGGLFRLDSAAGKDAKPSVKATKICSLDKPTALCFGSDGAIYATVVGEVVDGAPTKKGQLVKIEVEAK